MSFKIDVCKLLLIGFVLLGVLKVGSQIPHTLPLIPKEKLKRDIVLLQQGLASFHTGLYWYTPKDSIDLAFQQALESITGPMDALSFYRVISPLVALTREDHTNLSLPKDVEQYLSEEAKFFPLIIRFLDRKMYVIYNGDSTKHDIQGLEVESIDQVPVPQLVNHIGKHFATDGYVQSVKYSDLNGFLFSRQFYLVYGQRDSFEVTLKGKDGNQSLIVPAHNYKAILKHLEDHHDLKVNRSKKKVEKNLAYRVDSNNVAYLAVHSFYNPDYKKDTINRRYRKFLENTFADMQRRGVQNLILDISQNGGGHEGNENLLYSYLDDNYQKYDEVLVKAKKVVLDNGVDRPIRLKLGNVFDRNLGYFKREDGSLSRKPNAGHGLMAYKKEPKYKFQGNLFVIIGPVTYSGGSELANMLYTRDRGVFIGEETGGGYLGNTSGLSSTLVLPHANIAIDIPALQYKMNVKGGEQGRGVLPHHEVIPTIEEYLNRTPVQINFAKKLIAKSLM